jgi:hypothetical protein
MNNLEPLKTFISKGGNIPDLIKKSISSNNPVMGNLIDMANKGDTKGLENFARNLFKEKGRNFDEEFSEFMNNFK